MIRGKGFTMMSTDEYDLIQLINEIDMPVLDNKEIEQTEEFNPKILKTLAIGLGVLAAQFVVGTWLNNRTKAQS